MNIINNNYKLSLGFVHEAMWGGATSDNQEWPLRK